MDPKKPNIIISACIGHEACRWNGAMIQSDIVEQFKPWFNYITVCPERDIGLGVPRLSLRLVQSGENLRLVQNETDLDLTDKLSSYCDDFLGRQTSIDGFILKDRSPSCGFRDVKVYPRTGKVAALSGSGTGIFGSVIHERYRHVAHETEGRIRNFTIREHFLTHVFISHTFRTQVIPGSMKDLVAFHSRAKYLLMAYNQSALKKMGSLVANHAGLPFQEVVFSYKELLDQALDSPARIPSIINVLMHALGYFSEVLNAEEKAWFLDNLDAYRKGAIPLSVCNAILNSWIIRYKEKYLAQQFFFQPYPQELVHITDSGKGRDY